MFCNACGTENIDGAAYCSACGAKLVTENTADENGKASRTAFEKEKNAQRMRAELTELILRTYRQVQPQTENYQNAIAIKQRITDEERALRENEKRNPKRNLKTAIMLLIASIPVFLFLMSIAQPAESPAYFVGQLLGAFMLASPLFIPAIILFFTCRSETREKEKTANSLCSSIQKDETEAEEIATEIIGNYNSIPDNFIDFKYADPWSLWALYQIVSTGRADSLKEAILYFDELCHRQKMEDIALQQLNITQQIFDQTVEIRKSLDFIATMSTISAISASITAANSFR